MHAEVSFEVHKSHKDGSLFLDDGDYVDQRKYEQVTLLCLVEAEEIVISNLITLAIPN